MQSKLVEREIPAMRLIGSEEEGCTYNWQSTRAELIEFIQRQSKLTLISRKVHLIFSHWPDSELFNVDFSLIALEVVGPKVVSEEMVIIDREKMKMWCYQADDFALLTKEELISRIAVLVREHSSKLSLPWELIWDLENDIPLAELRFFVK